MKNTMISKAFLLLALCGGLSACGSSSWITAAQVRAFSQNGDTFGELSATLNPGSMVLPAISFPIVDPRTPGVLLGQVGIEDGLQGQSSLVLDLDLNKILKLPSITSNPTLPNGTAIPVTGLTSLSTFVIPISQFGSEAYLSVNSTFTSAMLGVALVIPEFTIGVNADLLTPFSIQGVTGISGVFTGALPSQSGFVMFADVSALFKGFANTNLVTAQSKAVATPNSTPVQFKSVQSNTYQIESMLYNLNANGSPLTIH